MSVKRKPGLSCKAKSKLSNPKVTPREIKVQAEVKPAENIEFIAAAHAYDLYEIQESAKQHPDKVDEIKAVALKLALDALGYAFEKRYVPGGHSQKIVDALNTNEVVWEALSSIQEVPAIEYPGQKSGQLKANTVPFMLKMIQQAQLEKNPPEKGLEGSRLDEDTEYYERLANLFPEKDDGKGEKNNLLDEIMPNLKFNRLFETAGNSDNDPSLLLKNATELNVLATEYNMKNWVKDPENSTELLRYINGLDSLLANNEDETSQETMKAMKIIREMRNDFTQIYEAIEG